MLMAATLGKLKDKMSCQCRKCGEWVGTGGVRSGIGMMTHFAIPCWLAAVLFPVFDRMNRLTLWEDFWPYFIGWLLFAAWIILRFWFTSIYFWLWFTLFKPCPNCKKRRWGLGECSGFGL